MIRVLTYMAAIATVAFALAMLAMILPARALPIEPAHDLAHFGAACGQQFDQQIEAYCVQAVSSAAVNLATEEMRRAVR